MAFELVALVHKMYFAAAGCALFSWDNIHSADRMWTADETALAYLVRPSLIFQIYNLLMTLAVPEFRTLLYVAHHIVMLATGLCALQPFAQNMAPFFAGIVEISSVFMYARTLTDKMGAPARVRRTTRVLFALTFWAVRAVAWPYFSWWLWRLAVFTLPPTPAWNLSGPETLVLTADVFFAALQWYWAWVILQMALKPK